MLFVFGAGHWALYEVDELVGGQIALICHALEKPLVDVGTAAAVGHLRPDLGSFAGFGVVLKEDVVALFPVESLAS